MKSFYTLRSQDAFRKSFKKVFDTQNEIEISEEILNKMKDELPQMLAEAFFDISDELNDPVLYKEFVRVFNVHAKELEDNTEVVDMMNQIE